MEDQIGDDFVLARLNYDKEIAAFSRRMQPYVLCFELLNTAIDQTLIQIKPKGRLEMTIYMSGRLCARQFEALFASSRLAMAFLATVFFAVFLKRSSTLST